jgi:heme O synthase-like polyprenyltransferase
MTEVLPLRQWIQAADNDTSMIQGSLLAWQLFRCRDADRRPARRLFAFSIIYLFVFFAMLLADAAAR